MTPARKALNFLDEAGVYVDSCVRRAVAREEAGMPDTEGDPLELVLSRVRTRPGWEQGLRFVASTASI